ncbi:MAG: putative phage tail protein [Oscillospiraceae bacterium]
MRYAEELKELLRPLGVYELDRGPGAAELEALGGALDGVFNRLESAETEALPLTARGTGLENWEALLPYAPASQSPEDRQRAIIALLRIDDSAFTVERLNATISGCGIRAAVAEAEEPQTVRVSFPGVRGVPEGFEQLRERIEQILPCHLQVNYGFAYLLWWELEILFRSWQALETVGPDWDTLEKTGEVEA